MIKRAQVLAHPIVIVEGFGVKVLVRALFANTRETFLEIVSRCAEEEAHLAMEELDLMRTVRSFIGFERRVGEIYRCLSREFAHVADAARFFETLSEHEEGHAIVLFRVHREIRRGRLWKQSKDLHFATVGAFDAKLEAYEEEVRRGVSLPRALEIVESIESSELDVVFDTLNGCVDMRSRGRFERFFVLSRGHLAYCRDQVHDLRTRHGIDATPRAVAVEP